MCAFQLRHDARQGIDQLGIEVGSALANDLLDDQLERPWQLVWAAGGERVEHVADGADAPDQGDLLAAQSMWIAAAVPALVMRTGDRLGHLDQRRA